MLDKFAANVGEERMAVPSERGLTFYQVMALASIVEREAVLDDERPLIAGVYQNRIDGIAGVTTRLLNADPTVFYAIDTIGARRARLPGLAAVRVLDAARRAARRRRRSRKRSRASRPTRPRASSRGRSARRASRRSTPRSSRTPPDKFIYFLAIPEGGGAHAFAKTKAEHDANRQKYGYIQ